MAAPSWERPLRCLKDALPPSVWDSVTLPPSGTLSSGHRRVFLHPPPSQNTYLSRPPTGGLRHVWKDPASPGPNTLL